MTIRRPPPPGPEFRDAPVTVLFTPYTPERRVNLGEGFAAESGCGHRGERRCTNRPDFLLRTNTAESGACFDHLSEVVEALIAEVQRRGGDLADQPGYLYRAAGPKRKPLLLQPVDYDRSRIVYETSIDRRYQLRVFRSVKSDRLGVLVVAEIDGPPLLECTVHLAYGAAYGPDGDDVAEWCELATAAVDARKPTHQLINEALTRRQSAQRTLYRKLRSSPEAQDAFRQALDVFANADTAVRWMLLPNTAFEGRTPTESVDAQSLPRVLELLASIRSWDLRMAARPSARPRDT